MDKSKKALEALRNDLHHVPMTDRLASAFRHLDAALSELEGSKPKELTDDAPFTAFESEHYKGSFGVSGPHYSVAGLVNISAAEALADKMNWAFRLGRDGGYLSPQPKEPPRYVMSRDYDAAYERVCNGERLFGEVDYNTRDGGAPRRDVVLVRRMKHGDIDIGVRGCGYGSVDKYDIKEHGSERAAFKWVCEVINLEWIAVEPPKEQGAGPVPADLIHERSKPSLMVGFSEEEIERIAAKLHPALGGQWSDDAKAKQLTKRSYAAEAIRYAQEHSQAVSIDKIMEVVKEATWINDVDMLRERLMKIMS